MLLILDPPAPTHTHTPIMPLLLLRFFFMEASLKLNFYTVSSKEQQRMSELWWTHDQKYVWRFPTAEIFVSTPFRLYRNPAYTGECYCLSWFSENNVINKWFCLFVWITLDVCSTARWLMTATAAASFLPGSGCLQASVTDSRPRFEAPPPENDDVPHESLAWFDSSSSTYILMQQ